MKRAVIYVFSGTGNTMRAAKLYKEQFEKNEIETLIKPITEATVPDDLSEYDYVGLGYPVHGFNSPYNVLSFAKKINKMEYPKNYFIFKTSGEPLRLNDCSSYKLKGIMKKRNFVLTNEYHYVMPYNMIFRHTDAMAYNMLEAMKQMVPADVKEITLGHKHLLRYLPFGHTLAWLFRIEHIAMKFNGKHFFKVDCNKCTHCGLCEKTCPMNNIKIQENGEFKFGSKCLMCARCSFNCPKDAFSIGLLNKWRVNGKYNFKEPESPEIDRHKNYCKKSYEKYFRKSKLRAEEYRNAEEVVL